MLGALSAANATGQLIFLPLLARVVERRGWRPAALIVAAAAASSSCVVLIFMRDRPEDPRAAPLRRAPDRAGSVRQRWRRWRAGVAVRSPAFWILAGTFFVCGASTNGLIGTHLIAACHDHGIPEVRSAQLLAMMGIFDIVGTTASGWLTDRYSSRHLLFGYYTLRGLSLLFLPSTLQKAAPGSACSRCSTASTGLRPCRRPCKLTSEAFGRENTGVIYGWIGASHQLGASMAAFGAGAIRTMAGGYQLAFWIAGVLCVLAGTAFLTVGRRSFAGAP